jgi:serine protease AprX
LFIPFPGHAQSPLSRYIILFTDKKGTAYNPGNPGSYLSAASLQRRVKQQIAVDSTDLPLSAVYLDSIASVPNVVILNASKWLNQVLIRTTDPAALAAISRFSFVRQALPVGSAATEPAQTGHAAKFPGDGIQGRAETFQAAGAAGTSWAAVTAATDQSAGAAGTSRVAIAAETSRVAAPGTANLINYGNTFSQIHIHHGEYLHNLGFRGQGMTIAVIDAGFSGYLGNPVFDSALSNGQILGSWDFVNNKQSVNEEDIHGMYCLSIMAANKPAIMVGSAPGAKFWLFKTEDLNSEYPVEEQNWAAAAEFADSAGADLITTSLGYVNFDDPSLDHTYPERDGHTAISTRAANFAVAKGMIVLASAGNSGSDTGDTKYVGCPGDADSALTVGATDNEGMIAPFSSWGPNAAGRIKPDVVSVGAGTTIASPGGDAATGSGTSFSTPNLAGLVACLWQAFPEFGNHAILDAVRQSSSRYPNPDGRYGYGLPDLEKAYGILQEARGVNAIVSRGNPWITAFPVPYSDDADLTVVFKGQNSGNVGLTLVDAMGRTVERQTLTTVIGQWYTIHFASTSGLSAGVYFIRYTDNRQQAVLQVVRK